jgi:hypothetical protein
MRTFADFMDAIPPRVAATTAELVTLSAFHPTGVYRLEVADSRRLDGTPAPIERDNVVGRRFFANDTSAAKGSIFAADEERAYIGLGKQRVRPWTVSVSIPINPETGRMFDIGAPSMVVESVA